MKKNKEIDDEYGKNCRPLKRTKKEIIVVKKRFGAYPGGYYYFIVPDNCSGRKNRYTTYRVAESPATRVKIIGRELPLGFSKKLAKEDGLKKK